MTGSPELSGSDPDERPFLTIKFYKSGRFTWDADQKLQPTEYIELKATVGTIALVLHQLMVWATSRMEALIARTNVDRQLASFLEGWDDGRRN